ncbi:RNA-binding protein NOB1 isoform X1 [Pieris rapae]|uniref:RNA-binding protein NOB1 isoform X1 n=1 Tax=Pieris rapae TaxID=64459 RepID=UPI001E27E9E8|nr:RNA-binding protein NOB1 isoform X1 [Pieris rapae]
MPKLIKHLVVDTTAFIKAEDLQKIAENVYTVQEVVDEITNDRQRRKLVVLPYDLKVKDVFTENIKFMTEFSKKTGDYTSLSATDIKIMALTYQMEKEISGIEHLKTEPTMQKTIKITGISGLTQDTDKKDEIKNNDETLQDMTKVSEEHNVSSKIKCKEDDEDSKFAHEIVEQIKNMELTDDKEAENIIVKVEESKPDESEFTSEDDDDGSEWITPSNLKEKKKEMDLGEFEEKNVDVACITSDFAMQNVLKQIGLNVTAVDGRIIRHLRTYIFRCTTCFKTTSVMTKLFCPKCGHATLRKVAVSVDEKGNQHIHINGRKPLSGRGKRFSLPTPKGGQHFQYPILTEDQHIHKRFATKLARNKTNALDPDYLAGFSPFAMKDVNSKSAVLGVRADKQDLKYWMKNYSKDKKK